MQGSPLGFSPGRSLPLIADPEVQIQENPQGSVFQQEEKQTIVHCHFLAFPGAMIRIWPSTFLFPAENPGLRIPLVHAENICFAPDWYRLDGYGLFTFSLIFAGLPGACSRFDLREEIDQAGAFEAHNILRNEKDVYHVQF